MKLEQAHIDQIRTAFEKMQSREDLLHVLNEAKPLVYGDKAVPFELKQLTWYANPKLGRKRYAEFKIKKKSGAERCIHAPVKGLKSLQKTLSFVLQCVYEPHNAAMGFVRDRSIVDNARLHVGSKYVYNIDLKDFFPSVDQARVWKCFQLKPFNLNKASSVEPQYMKWEDFENECLKLEKPVSFLRGKGRIFANTPYGILYVANNFDKEKDKFILLGSSSLKTKAGKSLEGTLWLVNKIPDTSRLDIANIIASLCCTEMEVERKNETGEWEKVKRNVLPQGAPTSPVITNIVCQRLDHLLSGVAKRFGLKYSRYADDITFSSMHNVYQPESEFLKELYRIIAEQNFYIKESKTRLQKDGYRKEVTGLLVNEKANVQKRYIKQLRMWLYYWGRYGYERASGFFLQQYIADKGHVKNGKPDMANVISGKLDHLKMVKGADNELYLKLKKRFGGLLGQAIDIKIDQEIFNSENSEKLLVAMQSALKKQIEAQLNIDNIKAKEVKISRNLKNLEFINSMPIHNPKKLADLLNKFSLETSPIKYSTHPIERNEQFNNFDDFVSNFKEEELIEIKKLNSDLWDYLIYPFLFQSNDELRLDKDKRVIDSFYWGEHKLRLGWKYKNLLKEMFEKQQAISNTKIYPLLIKIDKQYQPELRIEGKFLNTWNDFVEIFKNEIEFRYHNLEKTIKSITAPLNTNFNDNIEFEGLSGLNFYTYTSKIKEALLLLIYPYNKYAAASNPKLIIRGKYYEVEKKIEIRIINVNSYWDAILDGDIDKVSLKSGKGQLRQVQKLLYGLCDWSLETRLRVDNNYTYCRINYLSPKYKELPIEKNIERIIGHTHILTFYL